MSEPLFCLTKVLNYAMVRNFEVRSYVGANARPLCVHLYNFVQCRILFSLSLNNASKISESVLSRTSCILVKSAAFLPLNVCAEKYETVLWVYTSHKSICFLLKMESSVTHFLFIHLKVNDLSCLGI
jgi:hypothetical protein